MISWPEDQLFNLSETSPVSPCMIRQVLWGGGWANQLLLIKTLYVNYSVALPMDRRNELREEPFV